MATLAFAGAAALGLGPTGAGLAVSGSLPQPAPTIADYQFLSASPTPPAQSDCKSVGRRCFNPTSMQNSYNLTPLYKAGHSGQGVTIAIIDSFGNPNMASDLANFNTQMGTPHMCGEPAVTCTSGMPTFQHVYWNGKTQVKAPPPGSNGTIAGHGLGPINPTLYSLASGPNYSSDFYDVTTGNNQTDPSIQGYNATNGWDPITGLGTPNAANLVPALAGV